ncbi:methyltransferase [Gallionella capsiferriformans]|uniref:Methyltransferase small n=1 Tax=Gallionella capsiferriformans (strain ES-2) TaxID=395494 RepID=D9SCG6_GALCS|nr:class I SAM-dependent methyltransferase [Gallionella capsiferriformans]ADL56547.1 methyltransferase small [Gallionella capsiferriformans ES-2]
MHPLLTWIEAGKEQSARWRSESGAPPPKRVVIADDTMTADAAYRLACEGTALLWRGDYQNARQLLQAMARRTQPRKKKSPPATSTEAFNLHRQAQSQRSRTLNMLLLPFNADHTIPLRRAPDVIDACREAYGDGTEAYVLSLRGLLGVIGAHEWRKNGVQIPALQARIHPHYGVFSPVRGEYVELVANTPLPDLTKTQSVAFDIGTGTGVLAAVLAKRGIRHITATDQDERALACARDNLTRLKCTIDVVQADLFPEGRAALIVCNPPWLPARPSSPLEYAVYDPESRMLKGFLGGLAAHLEDEGEGWLILSDLAEHLGLRTRDELLALIDASGLQVLGKIDVKPHHPKAADDNDPLHAARAAELTSLWRLAAKTS